MVGVQSRRGELVVLRPAPWRRVCVYCRENVPAWLVNAPPDGPSPSALLGLTPCPGCGRRDPDTLNHSLGVIGVQVLVVCLVSGVALVVLPVMVWVMGWSRGGSEMLAGVLALELLAALLVGGVFGGWELHRVLRLAARVVKLGEVG